MRRCREWEAEHRGQQNDAQRVAIKVVGRELQNGGNVLELRMPRHRELYDRFDLLRVHPIRHAGLHRLPAQRAAAVRLAALHGEVHRRRAWIADDAADAGAASLPEPATIISVVLSSSMFCTLAACQTTHVSVVPVGAPSQVRSCTLKFSIGSTSSGSVVTPREIIASSVPSRGAEL